MVACSSGRRNGVDSRPAEKQCDKPPKFQQSFGPNGLATLSETSGPRRSREVVREGSGSRR